MSVIQMEPATFHEVEKLLGVMQKNEVRCSMEFKVEENDDPIMAMSDASIKADYYEAVDGDKFLIVDLNDANFSFSEKKCSFHKYFSGLQVDICISSDRFSVWFSSETLPLRAITELNKEAHP